MNLEELTWLQESWVDALLDENRDRDPGAFALGRQESDGRTPALASQLALRQAAAGKLPAWAQAKALLTRRALEQCSSEAVLPLKPVHSGKLALDLTGGLGVDSWHLAQHYEEVHYLDADPVMAALARINFQRLACTNVRVHQGLAEDFVASWRGPAPDLIYLDPDRRDAQGRRRYAFSDCRPDVTALMPKLLELAPRVLVKASPMVDLEEGARQLGNCTAAMALSLDGEVKEVLFECVREASAETRREARISRKGKTWSVVSSEESVQVDWVGPHLNHPYVLEPDVAVYKARLTGELFAELELPGAMNHSEGYFFAASCPAEFPGRVFRVLEQMAWKPKAVRRQLGQLGIQKAFLGRRYFDQPLDKVRQQLKLKEGGKHHLLLTRLPDGQRVLLVTERVS